MNDLFFSLLNILVVILLLFFMGSVSTFLLEKISKKKIPFFLSPILGLLISILTISIVKTGFSSIMVISFIPLLFLYQFGNSNRQIFDHPTLNVKKQIPNILFVVLLAFGFSIFEFLNIYSFEYDKVIIVPHYDYIWYARISHYMDLMGAENQAGLTNLLSDSTIRQPYHYPEIWFNVFAKQFSKLSHLHELMLVAYPILKSLVVYLFYNYASITLIKNNIWHKIFILLCLTICPLMLSEIYEKSELFKFHIGFTQTGLFSAQGKKYFIVFILSTLLIFEGIKNKNFIIISAMSSLIFLSSVGTIAIPLYLCFLVLPSFYFAKKIDLKTLAISFSCIAITITCFGGFYIIFGNDVGNKNITDSLIIIDFIKNPSFQYITKQAFQLLFNFIRLIVYLSPLFGILLMVKARFFHILNVFLFCFTATLFTLITDGILDNGQFLYNILPLVNIYFAYLVIENADSAKIKAVSAILILLFSINLYYNNKYQKTLDSFYNKFPLSAANQNLNSVNITLQGNLNVGTYDIIEDGYKSLNLKSTFHYNYHLYLYYSDKVLDLMNLSLLNFIKKENELPLSDLYLLKASESYYYLKKNNLEPTPENIEILKKKLNVTFQIENGNLNFKR